MKIIWKILGLDTLKKKIWKFMNGKIDKMLLLKRKKPEQWSMIKKVW